MAHEKRWYPPDFTGASSRRFDEIGTIFATLFPSDTHGKLAKEITAYWISRLADVWKNKKEHIKEKDLAHHPEDPLTRIQQKAVVIAYADSVREEGRATLGTLETFLTSRFPAVGGLHLLPPCEMSDRRFNDGGFSQIRRDRIHAPYGSNDRFERLMEKFFSMTDFVLNHVDIAHPRFKAYLEGDDISGRCFFVFTEPEYRKRRQKGDFDNIFRPRPFPLFTLFRRKPAAGFGDGFPENRFADLNRRFETRGLTPLPTELICMLYLFTKVKNDQMLLAEDYGYLERFMHFLQKEADVDPGTIFEVSQTQETHHTPYTFKEKIQNPEDLLSVVLPEIGVKKDQAGAYAAIYADCDVKLFGQPIRALTTFSHVQVDLNTATFEGLKLLIDDFSWYLGMDLNMLRLDAANFAYKKWGTSCFGLPEVTGLMKILYLSMACVSPRIVPNLEVNAPLDAVLQQMADKKAPPPMMYDFHLACMLPVVFNIGDARPLLEIFNRISRYDIPQKSIRFSLDESHDGKSVAGSGGDDPLLTYAQRRMLMDVVADNGGYVKYKSTSRGRISSAAFEKICTESGIDTTSATASLFEGEKGKAEILFLKPTIRNGSDISRELGLSQEEMRTDPALSFFSEKIIGGREPYELCVATRDALGATDSSELEASRYLALKTLAFALMGRHVKAVYFNDLMGLGNNYALVEETGELRNIKRTKSFLEDLEKRLDDRTGFEGRIAGEMNNLIALADADPAFDPRGGEASLSVDPAHPAVAVVHVTFRDHHTVVVVNTGDNSERVRIDVSSFGKRPLRVLHDNLEGRTLGSNPDEKTLDMEINPFGRHWITKEKVKALQLTSTTTH